MGAKDLAIHYSPIFESLRIWFIVSVHRFSVPRSRLVFCLELAPIPENKGYRSEIRGFSLDFMDVRNKKSRALKFKPKILIYAL
jgi:hypothetical protein